MLPKIKDDFTITGYFYNIENYEFRKYLNIKRKNSKIEEPDLMVIMMNPGSSKQMPDFIDIFDKEVPTIPDNTQSQIMKVMNNANFQYARVLNLSDLREAKSPIFIKKIDELRQKKIAHSIFDDSRNADFKRLFVSSIPVICAWGVNPKLLPLAQKAFKKIKNEKLIGTSKAGVPFAYYHPLPQNNDKQKEWVEIISNTLNNL